MDRERWQSYPLRSDEERVFFRLLSRQAGSDERTVTIETAEGGTRRLTIRRTLAIEEPGPVSGSAVCRITFVEGTLAPGERVKEDLWLLASELLDAAEARARSGDAPKSRKKAMKKAPRPKTKAKAKLTTKTKAKTKKKAAARNPPAKKNVKKKKSPKKRSR
ncbi:MAG TPA: hypothetical protein VGR00_05175 [Thermoanaerobaculia bacterium]|nr:hypothetical protein [Thermoanaerobaculia bacterium]